MCTVTLAATADAWRMVCSRDERHARPAALPPQRRACGDRQAIMPVDPVSDGTWVAANDAGLVLTLLNFNPENPPTDRDLSRGGVVTTLASCATLAELCADLKAIDTQRMMPFRLVASDGKQVVAWRSIDPPDSVIATPFEPDHPVMFTSSGLGDHLVEPPRRELFDRWFSGSDQTRFQEQDAFHHHRWQDHGHLSVCMEREDARTVSLTTTAVTEGRIAMTYHANRPRPACG